MLRVLNKICIFFNKVVFTSVVSDFYFLFIYYLRYLHIISDIKLIDVDVMEKIFSYLCFVRGRHKPFSINISSSKYFIIWTNIPSRKCYMRRKYLIKPFKDWFSYSGVVKLALKCCQKENLKCKFKRSCFKIIQF